MQFTPQTLLTAGLCLISSFPTTTAHPLETRSEVAPNAQSCTAKDHGAGLNGYTVYVGEKVNANVCSTIENKLVSAVVFMLNGVHCKADKGGNFYLSFMSNSDYGKEINNALHELFPAVNGFNCPNH
jgi:hypothetical protein